MDAMIVSPAPSSSANQTTSNKTSTKGSETSFAPSLNEAINEKKTSSEQSDTSSGDKTGHPHTYTTKTETRSTKEEENPTSDQSPGGLPITAEQIRRANGSASTAHLHSSTIVNGERESLFPGQGKNGGAAADETLMRLFQDEQAKLKEGLTALAQKSGKQQGIQEHAVSSTSDRLALSNQKSDFSFSGQFNTKDVAKISSLQMQAKDAITVSQTGSTATPNQEQRFTPTSLLESMASRANNSVELSGHLQGNLANTSASLPLSAEKIAAQITGLPFQQSLRHEGLREGGQSLRHDWLGNFIEAKVDRLPGTGEGKSGQQLLNSDAETSANSSTLSMPKGGEKAVDATFSHTLQHVADKTLTPGSELQRPGSMNIMLSQLQENDLLHQVINKIRISHQMRDSKVTMKLHPAELGNLKINIQLKEGVISANVVAQSQQVQDVLERNMHRLRTLMEEQGLKISEITIELDNDPTDGRNLFQDHLAQDDRDFNNQQSPTSGEKFVMDTIEQDVEENIETLEIGTTAMDRGVNVLI